MRLDKFLKVSRIIKRRTLSKEISESSRVKVNGKVAKPSTRLKVGDEIEIEFGRSLLTVRVKELKEHVLKEDSTMLYEIIKEERIQRDIQLARYLLFIIIIYENCLIDIAIWYTIYKEVKGDFYVRKISLGKIY